jgi:hypothetical protein
MAGCPFWREQSHWCSAGDSAALKERLEKAEAKLAAAESEKEFLLEVDQQRADFAREQNARVAELEAAQAFIDHIQRHIDNHHKTHPNTTPAKITCYICKKYTYKPSGDGKFPYPDTSEGNHNAGNPQRGWETPRECKSPTGTNKEDTG